LLGENPDFSCVRTRNAIISKPRFGHEASIPAKVVKTMSDEPVQEGPPETQPIAEPPRRRLTCWYCDSDDLSRGLTLGVPGQGGAAKVGVQYEATGKFLGIVAILGDEPLRVTLCNQCGTVVRLSVKDTDHKWY
jgi:hypothetical protein